MADMLKAAELGLIRPEEFRKNAPNSGGNYGNKKHSPKLKLSQIIPKG
jgi:hypothetical protein